MQYNKTLDSHMFIMCCLSFAQACPSNLNLEIIREVRMLELSYVFLVFKYQYN